MSRVSSKLRRLLVAVVVLSVTGFEALSVTARADSVVNPTDDDHAAPTVKSLKLGFNGLYKIGTWAPANIAFHAPIESWTGTVSIESLDGDGALCTVMTDLSLRPGRETVEVLIKPGRPQAELIVGLHDRTRQLLTERVFGDPDISPALLATQELILEVNAPLGLSRLQTMSDPNSLERTAVTQVSEYDLPVSADGYQGVDVVAIATSKSTAEHNVLDWRVDALEQWVRLGGRLIVCVGRNGAVASNPKSPLARFFPGTFGRVVDRGPGAWESFTGAADPMRGEFGARPAPIATTVLDNVRGKVELKDGEIPLVVRSTYGFGEVIFIAADLDQAPFVEWPALGRLWLRILNREEPSSGDTSERESLSQGMRLGYTDLSGQLRFGLDQFEGVELVPFWMIALMGGAYVLLLFPVEYWLAGRARRYVEIAWLTFPLVVISSGSLIYSIVQNRKGTELRVNAIELIDTDLIDGAVRGNAWYGLFSPKAERYNLSIVEQNDGHLLSWLGMPGTGLGGMNSTVVTPLQFTEPYEIDRAKQRLHGVPMAAWSSKAFFAAWSTKCDVDSSMALTTNVGTRTPKGKINNRSKIDLKKCVLFYDGWIYQLGDLGAGQSVDVDEHQGTKTIQSYLTERRLVGEKEQATPYDPAAPDLTRILRLIQFHEAAGGRQYTGLSNRYYAKLDMSDQLNSGRAVLLAESSAATTTMKIESTAGENKTVKPQTTIYRFVFRVEGNWPTAEVDLKIAQE